MDLFAYVSETAARSNKLAGVFISDNPLDRADPTATWQQLSMGQLTGTSKGTILLTIYYEIPFADYEGEPPANVSAIAELARKAASLWLIEQDQQQRKKT